MHANVDKRARLIEFALEAQGLEPEELQGALPGAVLTELDFPNIQGFVVRGYRLPAAGYLFLRIDDGAKARAFLGDFIPQVITAERWDVKPESGINVAFSYEGLRALGVADASLAGFPAEFRDGMASRAELLGDVGESAPEHWEDCFRSGDAHVLVMISAKDPAALAERDRRIRELVAAPRRRERGRHRSSAACCRPAASTSATPTGSRSRRSRAAGSRTTRARARPARTATGGRSRPASSSSATPTSRARCPPRRRPTTLSRNGSYVVYRKLRQDVAAFRRQLREAAALYPGGEELLAAKLVGRWRDGTPLDSSPHAEDPGAGGRQVAQQRVRLRPRPGRAALPGRLAHPPHEPAAEHAVRGQAREPPPADPARHHLRRACCPRAPRTTAATAA